MEKARYGAFYGIFVSVSVAVVFTVFLNCGDDDDDDQTEVSGEGEWCDFDTDCQENLYCLNDFCAFLSNEESVDDVSSDAENLDDDVGNPWDDDSAIFDDDNTTVVVDNDSSDDDALADDDNDAVIDDDNDDNNTAIQDDDNDDNDVSDDDDATCVPSEEICDNKDNDCDGAIDEELTRECNTICGTGREICRNGEWVDCDAQPPQPEICDDLVDNNCDGQIDDGCPCADNYGQGYPEGYILDCDDAPLQGMCRPGKKVCLHGEWLDCQGTIGTAEEICDGQDNDCDNEIDEDCPCHPGDSQPCGNKKGECAKIDATQGCLNGNWGQCINEIKPVEEICDGLDNDCDGEIDEDLTRECQSECGTGKEICKDAKWRDCDVLLPQEEVCDGLDNDCDGEVDEGVKNTYCYDGDKDGRGTGKNTIEVCSLPISNYVLTCDDCDDNDAQKTPNKSEVCDNKDNNCNGQIDEDLTSTCGSGKCAGTKTCSKGYWSNCSTYGADCDICCKCSTDGTETYDSTQDTDCTPTVCPASLCGGLCGEHRYTVYPSSEANVCASLNKCTEYSCSYSCENDGDRDQYSASCGDCDDANRYTFTGAPEICDNKDNNCDGAIDEELTLYYCPKQNGVCQGSSYNCINGMWTGCATDDYLSHNDKYETNEATCDGLDNDCDGQIDESMGNTYCGIGECRHSVDNCVNGAPQACLPLDPQEEICDNKDNDCDGHVDMEKVGESYWVSIHRSCSTICGEGKEICYYGQWNYCDAPKPSEEICDNKDNDCNGQIDEEVASCYPIIYAAKTQGFPYYSPAKCLYGYTAPVTVPGRDLLDCSKVDFVSQSSLTVSFDYKASANTCFQKPYFVIQLRENTATFIFPNCSSEGSSSLTVGGSTSATVDNLSFILTSGDWGSTVRIKAITFNH